MLAQEHAEQIASHEGVAAVYARIAIVVDEEPATCHVVQDTLGIRLAQDGIARIGCEHLEQRGADEEAPLLFGSARHDLLFEEAAAIALHQAPDIRLLLCLVQRVLEKDRENGPHRVIEQPVQRWLVRVKPKLVAKLAQPLRSEGDVGSFDLDSW